MTASDRIGQGCGVDQVTSRDVDDAGAGLHLGKRRSVDHPAGLGGGGHVQRDEVATGVQVVDLCDPLDAEFLVAALRDERVVRDDVHPQSLGALGHETADASQSHDAEGLAGHLDPAELGALPRAFDQAGVGLRDVARLRQDQRDRVLGRRQRVGLGRVAHHDPPSRRRRDIHVVDAGAGSADHLEAGAALDQVGRDLGGAAHDDSVVGVDSLRQLVFGPRGSVVNRHVPTQVRDAGVCELLAHEHAQVGPGELPGLDVAPHGGYSAPLSESLGPGRPPGRSPPAFLAATDSGPRPRYSSMNASTAVT